MSLEYHVLLLQASDERRSRRGSERAEAERRERRGEGRREREEAARGNQKDSDSSQDSTEELRFCAGSHLLRDKQQSSLKDGAQPLSFTGAGAINQMGRSRSCESLLQILAHCKI